VRDEGTFIFVFNGPIKKKMGRWSAQKIDRPNKKGRACDVPRTDGSLKRTIVIQWMKLNGVTWLHDN
jgi:hypothetical protein